MDEFNVLIFYLYASTYCNIDIISVICYPFNLFYNSYLNPHRNNNKLYFLYLIIVDVSCIQNNQWKY